MTSTPLYVNKLSKHAILPQRMHAGDAGYDLFSAQALIVPARGKGLVLTDLSIAVPPGCYGRIAPRSGLAWKQHIDIGAGVIDRGFIGNVGVILFNHAETEFKVEVGDRIAQLIIEVVRTPDVVEVENLDQTERGESGFGSTGKRKMHPKVDASFLLTKQFDILKESKQHGLIAIIGFIPNCTAKLFTLDFDVETEEDFIVNAIILEKKDVLLSYVWFELKRISDSKFQVQFRCKKDNE